MPFSGSLDPSTIMAPVRESLPQFDDNTSPRRNISIFSRKGISTPEPISVCNAQERTSGNLNMARGHSKLISRKKIPDGTILHAVPPANVHRSAMTPLEERMATDPNNEIVSSIMNKPNREAESRSASHPAAAIENQSVRGGSSSRIGTWVDGVVHWEERIPNEHVSNLSTSAICADHRTTPSSHGPPDEPLRKVNIPTELLRPLPTRSVVLAPAPGQLRASPDTPTRCVAASDRSFSPTEHVLERGQSVASKRSQSPVSDISHVEENSACSSRSSATSVETALISDRALRTYDKTVRQARHFDDHDLVHHQDTPLWTQLIQSSFLLDPSPTSPTISQAEAALKDELESLLFLDRPSINLEQDALSETWMQNSCHALRRASSVRKVMQPPSATPHVPQRSRKREWCKTAASSGDAPRHRRSETQLKASANAQDASALKKTASVSVGKAESSPPTDMLRPSLPRKSSRRPLSRVVVEDEFQRMDRVENNPPRQYDVCHEAEVAEEVLLHILSSLNSLQDLANTALMNKGMYRIFKENEMNLLLTVIYNESPALWEFQEWCSPAPTTTSTSSPAADLSLTYVRCYRRDGAVVEQLKQLILGQCQTFIRRETALALSDPEHSEAQRFNDAFWRVWSFCKIFGCGKGREEDIAGQIDWLRGGVIANEDCVSATVDTTFDLYTASVLLNPPECFARGNEGGLSAAQLFDMTEIWTCMTVLLQKYHGQLELARQYGIFDNCHVPEGDFAREENHLEEWTLHLLTLGSDVVLEMAELASSNEGLGFAVAARNGWTHWSPQGSRRNFLREPVSRCYEEQVAKMQQVRGDPREQAKKDNSRRRVSSLAAEIRLRRQSSDYRLLPLIDMEHERPMSMSSRQNSVRSARSGWTDVSPISPIARDTSAMPFSAVSPFSQWPTPRSMAPILEERVQADSRLAGRNYGRGFADDTSLRAVRQLVSMGFPEHKAQEALRMTDMGDGLRVDRAVELLLREQE